jgi:hypothetical protein
MDLLMLDSNGWILELFWDYSPLDYNV